MGRTANDRAVPIGPQLGRLLDTAYEARLPVLLSGPHGIGKSAYVAAWARARGLEARALDLSLLEATDLTGIPYVERARTHFAAPAFLPCPSEGPGVLVLEELNRCDRSVRQPCLQLLTARRLNDYELPPDCFLVACVNPADGTYDVDELDPALASRFLSLTVAPDRTSWLAWARSEGLYAPLLSFVERHAPAFESVPPRTWTQLSRLIQAASRTGLGLDEVKLLAGSVLPAIMARALITELAKVPDEVPPPDALVAAPDVHARRWSRLCDEGRVDRVQSELHGLVAWLARERPVIDESLRAALKLLAVGLPADLRERLWSRAIAA